MNFYKIGEDYVNLDLVQELSYNNATKTLSIFYGPGVLTDATIPEFSKSQWAKLQTHLRK